MVWTGGIHAREYAPQEVGMKYIEWLLDNYETDANARMMLDSNRYHFIVHNPDGRSIAEQQITARQRKNTNYATAACSTARSGGVDLNRNYPFGWRTGGPGASDNQCAEDYRGTAAVSEPETQVVLDYVRGSWNQAACKWEGGALPDGRPKSATYCNAQNRDNGGAGEFDWKTGADENYGGGVFIDLHSAARAILWSWGVRRSENENNIQTPNNLGLATIAQRMAYHNKYSAQQVLGYDTEGTTKDAVYGYLGAPSYTVEMGRSFYESCDNFNKEVYPENFNGFHYLSRVLYRPYQLPQGPDTVDVKIAAEAVQAGAKALVTATVDDNRYLYSKPGQSDIPAPPVPVVKKIKTALAYVGKLPWEAGAVGIPLALSASDQASPGLEEATRTASGMLDTTGLAPGRHMVYVQGINEDDKPGSVSAAFLNVKAAPEVTPEQPVMPIAFPFRRSGARWTWSTWRWPRSAWRAWWPRAGVVADRARRGSGASSDQLAGGRGARDQPAIERPQVRLEEHHAAAPAQDVRLGLEVATSARSRNEILSSRLARPAAASFAFTAKAIAQSSHAVTSPPCTTVPLLCANSGRATKRTRARPASASLRSSCEKPMVCISALGNFSLSMQEFSRGRCAAP